MELSGPLLANPGVPISREEVLHAAHVAGLTTKASRSVLIAIVPVNASSMSQHLEKGVRSVLGMLAELERAVSNVAKATSFSISARNQERRGCKSM